MTPNPKSRRLLARWNVVALIIGGMVGYFSGSQLMSNVVPPCFAVPPPSPHPPPAVLPHEVTGWPAKTVVCHPQPGGLYAQLHAFVNGPSKADVCYGILKQNPYAGPESWIHTHVSPAVADWALSIMRNGYMIEGGSFRGGSALQWVAAAKRAGKKPGEFVLHTMDPWSGSVSMWQDLHHWLIIRDGLPHLWEQFAQTITSKDAAPYIVPTRLPAATGIKVISAGVASGAIPVVPEVIYIDSAHEAEETYYEIETAYKLIPVGGALLGDDFTLHHWPAVVQDVVAFAETLPCAKRGNDTACQADWTNWPYEVPCHMNEEYTARLTALRHILITGKGCTFAIRKL